LVRFPAVDLPVLTPALLLPAQKIWFSNKDEQGLLLISGTTTLTTFWRKMAEVTEKQAAWEEECSLAKKEAKIKRKDTNSKSPLPPPPR
jgi:hypothetical protein